MREDRPLDRRARKPRQWFLDAELVDRGERVAGLEPVRATAMHCAPAAVFHRPAVASVTVTAGLDLSASVTASSSIFFSQLRRICTVPVSSVSPAKLQATSP